MKPIPEMITSAGLQYFEKCRCGGMLKYKFKHPQKNGYTVEWLVLYAKFKVVNRNKVIVAATPLSKFTETWQTL